MANERDMVFISCVLLFSTGVVLGQETSTPTEPSTTCAYTAYSYDYSSQYYYSYTTYKYCSSGCCGYTDQYCCSDFDDFSSVSSAIANTISTAAIVGIVIGSLIAAAIVVGIVACIICSCRNSGSNGMVYQQMQTPGTVTVSNVQSTGQPGFAYPVQTNPVSTPINNIQPTSGVLPPYQPGMATSCQPMTGAFTNPTYRAGQEAGVGQRTSVAPPPGS